MANLCDHSMVYYGPLDILYRKTFLEVVDSWRCTKCGMVRVGKRGIGTTSSTQGMYPDPPNPSYKWIFFVCFEEEPPRYELFAVKPGSKVSHECAGDRERNFVVNDDFSIVTDEGSVPTKHVAYLFETIFKGYIDLTTRPPKVITVRDVRKIDEEG